MTRLNPLDQSIINMINTIRADHHACTAGAVALRLQLSKSYIINRCELLRAQGIITWTSFPGSLRVVTPEAVDAAEPTAAPVDAPIVSSLPVTEPPKPPAKRAGRPRKNVDGYPDKIGPSKPVTRNYSEPGSSGHSHTPVVKESNT